jgi:DNA-binding NarL/FixJ family response regulator
MSELDSSPTQRPIQLLVLESDPVSRLGLVTYLSRFSDIQIVAEAETTANAVRLLADRVRRRPTLDLLLIGLPTLGEPATLDFCQQVKTIYPSLRILLLAVPQDPYLPNLKQMDIAGCVIKGDSLLNLITAIRQVAVGETSWSALISEQIARQNLQPSASEHSPTAWRQLRVKLRSMGLQQIDQTLNQINQELRSPNLSLPYYLLLTGQRRELRAAAQVLRFLLPATPTRTASASRPSASRSSASRSSIQDSPAASTVPESTQLAPRSTPLSAALATTSTALSTNQLSLQQVQSQLFDGIAAALQTNLENNTPLPLEIDILRVDKRRELLLLTLQQFERLLADLHYSQVQPEQLAGKQAPLLLDLWTTTTTEFFGRYVTLPIDQQVVELVPTLLQDASYIQRSLLNKIPQVRDLLSYFLFQAPLMIDATSQPFGSSQAFYRASQLLENLIIQVANAVVQPLMNHFAESEVVKDQFYVRSRLSTREIERFRNELSWRYRVEHYIYEPQTIFESRYELYNLNSDGICRNSIYAPRRQELEYLKGFRLAVTLALELRDAVTPRLRSLITFVGRSVVYLLTEVIGRGIGLIGRGIAKGIGNSWQENKRVNEVMKVSRRWR